MVPSTCPPKKIRSGQQEEGHGVLWGSPPWSRRTSSNLLVAPLSKCQHSGKTNSVQDGPTVGLQCRQGHGGTVPHYSFLVNLEGVLEPSLGLDLINSRSRECYKHEFKYLIKFENTKYNSNLGSGGVY